VDYNAIVIGAGTSGLSIAALLGAAGFKPLVLEKQPFIGGRARTWHKDGFNVDYGIHILRGSYQKVFHPLNMEIHKATMPFSKGIIIDDHGILHKLPKLYSFFKAKFLSSKDISSLIRHFGGLFLVNPKKYFNISIKQWLDGIHASPQIQILFKLLSMTLLVCPFLERASFGELLLNLRHLNLTGLGHPIGGFQQVQRALLWKINQCGGKLQLRTKVEQIIIKNGKAIGIRASEKEFYANLIVSTIPIQQLPKILDESLLEKKYSNYLKNLRPTSGISIDYGLIEKLYREVMFLVPDPAILGSFTSNIDPTTAPKNKQLVTFLNILNAEDIRNKQRAREKLKQAENKIFTTFPKLPDKIEWRRTLFLEVVDGVELNINQTQDKRPDVQVPGISNLYIASDSTRAEGAGGDIAFSSAKLCFNRIIQLKKRI